MKQTIGTKWDDTFEKNIFTEEEIQASNLRVAFMTELIKARSEKGITQKQLETLTGIKQPVIARMETGKTSPRACPKNCVNGYVRISRLEPVCQIVWQIDLLLKPNF